ncbi:hypothetical protein L9G74_00295 [Shewanella sp. C32]|uniref:ATP-binding protein n=1 Tax=Shewanella electrica TaxID=515560 RepID=A0ABT2FFD7_9GAMM|nr:hypothetical protein [Shewanella electrica]MCH1925049.1 hypothetical protein [Shewanella electrica]MCS4554873.1 hypothetical protein [Shewanella electrica]
MSSIILNLEKPEYDEYFSTDELWQQQAADILVKHLEKFGIQAADRTVKNSLHIDLNSIHDAILISGGRGTGKSVFLKNAKSIWKKKKKDDGLVPALHFTPIIDPTLLQDHDSFTNVLIAHIYNQVICELNSSQRCSSRHEINEKKFYDSLRKLAEAIEQPGDISEHAGLDKIIQYSSGIKIDKLFYEFVAAAKNILNCDAIVLPIDDVDMALGKAYSVLEEIRRRLSCPDIIPIVSGDLELYQHLVKLKLANDLNSEPPFNDNDSQFRDEKSKELSEAYVTKVLPNQYRIALQPIEDLVSSLIIKDPELTIPNHKQSYQDYQHNLKRYFFGSINSEEKSADYPLPSSAREVGQLVRLLPPSILCKTDFNQQLSLQDWESMRIWAEGKQHGASYVLARSAIQLLHKKEQPFRLTQLMAFNVKEQAAQRLPWAKYDYIDEQKRVAKVYAIADNDNLLSNTIRDKILRSMPPLEMHTDRMSITNDNAKEDKSKLALGVYTNWAYYSTQGNQQRKIFFSRAFELLATSLFMASSLKNENKEAWKDIFINIFNSVPFYSIHALNPTKTVNENSPDDLENGSKNITASNDANEDIKIIVDFSNELINWVEKYASILQDYITDTSHLIALLSAVFNKAFSQLNILRERYHNDKNKEDQLLDAILRYRYILVNAFASFIKSDGVVQANLALDTLPTTLRDINYFSSFSSTYKRNVGWIHTSAASEHSNNDTKGALSESSKDDLKDTTVDKIENTSGVKFLESILNHPIFTGLGINIDDCVDVESAPITFIFSKPKARSSSNSNQKLGNTTKQKKVRGKSFTAINKIAMKGKRYDSPDELIAAINSEAFAKEEQKNLFTELNDEMTRKGSKIDDYKGKHVNVYKILESMQVHTDA